MVLQFLYRGLSFVMTLFQCHTPLRRLLVNFCFLVQLVELKRHLSLNHDIDCYLSSYLGLLIVFSFSFPVLDGGFGCILACLRLV